jgi:hypothetical protein
MSEVGNDRVREAGSHTSKIWVVALCVCVVWSGGCFTRRPASPQLGQVTLAHPLVPTATESTEMAEPPEISLEELALPPHLAPSPSGPAKPHVAPAPANEPTVVEKKPAPVLAPELSLEEVVTSKVEANKSLIVAQRNLDAALSKPLNSAQADLAAKVRGFMDAAREAMNNSDWERAAAVAKKAEVLSEQLVSGL